MTQEVDGATLAHSEKLKVIRNLRQGGDLLIICLKLKIVNII